MSVVLANTYAAADPLTYAAFESWALVAEAAGMPVMMRQQAPWVFSTGFYAQQPGKLAGFLAEMDNTNQPASSFAAQIAALIRHDAPGGSARSPRRRWSIACEDDIVIKPALSRRLHEALPGSAWELLAGGHATFLENPVLWNATVLEFIDAHRAHPRPGGGAGRPDIAAALTQHDS